MPIAKKHSIYAKKDEAASFTKKKVQSSSFKDKIERANKILSQTVLLKKNSTALH